MPWKECHHGRAAPVCRPPALGEDSQRRWRFENAAPDLDFRYFSNVTARLSSANSMTTTGSQGVAFAVSVQ